MRAPNASRQTLLVLERLLQSPKSWHYGYALSRDTGLKSGTLYPILARLADIGWLETRWSDAEITGRPRHTCRLTGDGAKAARLRIAEAGESRGGKRLRLAPAGSWRS